MLGAALAIAWKDLRQRFRDRSALVLGFVAPIAMVVLMGSAFGGVSDLHVRMAVVDLDGGPVAEGLREALASPELADLVDVTDHDDVASARRAVVDGDVDAAIVLPRGLTDSAAGGDAVAPEVLSSVDSQLSGEIAAGIASSLMARVTTARLTAVAAEDAGLAPDDVAAIAAEAAEADPAVVAEAADVGSRPLDGVAYFGPAFGMFFALFGVGFSARGFVTERTTGTLDRIVASPVRPEAVLLGKALSVFVYSLASLLTMAAVTAGLLGASWGSPVGVVVLCIAMAGAVVALSALVMSVARSERQAEAFSSVLTFALALLGGSFLFLGDAPPLMRRLATLTPNGWALRGFTDLGTGVDTWTAVTVPVLAIAAFSLVVGVVAAVAGRGALVR